MPGPAVKFVVAPKIVVASLEKTGASTGVADAMKELQSWIDSKGIEQVGYPSCMYYDNPTETPEPELRSEVCIPVDKVTEGEGKFRIKEMAETVVAETRHQRARSLLHDHLGCNWSRGRLPDSATGGEEIGFYWHTPTNLIR